VTTWTGSRHHVHHRLARGHPFPAGATRRPGADAGRRVAVNAYGIEPAQLTAALADLEQALPPIRRL
jgi:hypothetical protein